MAKAKRSLASRVVRTKTETPSVEAQEKALQKLQEQQEKAGEKTAKRGGERKPKKVKTRVSVDFPHDIYEVMKKDTQKKGQTLKGFIVAMVREHYGLD